MPGLIDLLAPYGAPHEGIIELRGPAEPRHLPYLNLLQDGLDTCGADGVVEQNHEAIAYVVDAHDHLPSPQDLQLLGRRLALREDAPYLLVIQPGRLLAYELGIKTQLGLEQALVMSERADTRSARTAFHRLHWQPQSSGMAREWVHEALFELLIDTIRGLTDAGVGRDDALSLAGRALFLRFLKDRKIVGTDQWEIVAATNNPRSIFKTPESVLSVCSWLDRTFNGDFLPLSSSVYRKRGVINPEVCAALADIMTGARQQRFEWASVDFSFIPVGVLSQVYESSAETFIPHGRKGQSMYYTPRRIAEYMVREIFTGIGDGDPVRPHRARVLDPAVGGGIFLVAAYQELAEAFWRYYGAPPATSDLRLILYDQLRGFDIHEPALRLAALSLYLKAIELDLDPHPVEKLRFQPLRDQVLFNMREVGADENALTGGSISSRAGGAHYGSYDVVVGNPPWTALASNPAEGRVQSTEERKHAGRIHDEMRRVVEGSLMTSTASNAEKVVIPDRVPDLLFVWQAMRWARRGGWIGFALHARLLFKESVSGYQARIELFRALQITGILNGTDLRNTEVWPGVTAPFCLLFARNLRPKDDDEFYFVSPYREAALNRQGRLRIDSQAALPVSVGQVTADPHIFKCLFRGSVLDYSILQRLRSAGLPGLQQYCEKLGMEFRQGFQVFEKGEDNDASFLIGRPTLAGKARAGYLVEGEKLPQFRMPTLHRPRAESIYAPPLLLIRESPSIHPGVPRAHLAFTSIAYSESYFGLSAASVEGGDELLRYLFILAHSRLLLWYVLMTSAKFGVERDALQKRDLESFPVVPLDLMPPEVRRCIYDVSRDLIQGSETDALDRWVALVYGLDSNDRQVVSDSLLVGAPFTSARRVAERRPSRAEVNEFAGRLEDLVAPFGEGVMPKIRTCESVFESPWEIISVVMGDDAMGHEESELIKILNFADELGASEVFVGEASRKRLLIARLRQFRYWTETRARLTASQLVEMWLPHLRASE